MMKVIISDIHILIWFVCVVLSQKWLCTTACRFIFFLSFPLFYSIFMTYLKADPPKVLITVTETFIFSMFLTGVIATVII